MSESLSQFSKFIAEQVAEQVKEHKEEMKSMDALRVRMVKESAEKIAEAKKKFFMEAAEKMEKFTNEAVARELSEFRKDIAESRKKSFGSKIFEAFAKEFAVKFFNEDKVVKSMMESVKSSQNKLSCSNKLLESKLKEELGIDSLLAVELSILLENKYELDVLEQAEITIKYEGYINKTNNEVLKMLKLEGDVEILEGDIYLNSNQNDMNKLFESFLEDKMRADSCVDDF